MPRCANKQFSAFYTDSDCILCINFRLENTGFLCYIIDTRGDTNVQVALRSLRSKTKVNIQIM